MFLTGSPLSRYLLTDLMSDSKISRGEQPIEVRFAKRSHRPRRGRPFCFLVFALAAVSLLLFPRSLPAASLQIKSKAAILKNVNTGQILFSKNADKPIPPASITKVLTLYLVFEAMDEGKVHPADRVPISRQASSTRGSRMHVGAGERIELDELIKGTAVVSGNDAAVALAEYVDGDIPTFVHHMNAKARELGMSHSRFRNPHGLPAKGQFTTARDILTLSEEYLRHFPESLHIHSMTSYTFQDVTQRNRNRLLGVCPEVDGLKTGFTRASGYNIVVTAQRDGMRLIAVVMGAKSPKARTAEAKKLIDQGFRMAQAPSGKTQKASSVGRQRPVSSSGEAKPAQRSKNRRSRL